MSSVLNVSNGRSKPEEFSIKDIEMLVDSEKQNWFKRTHVGKSLGLIDIHRSTGRLVDKYPKTQAFLKAEGGCHNATPSREDEKGQEQGAYETHLKRHLATWI